MSEPCYEECRADGLEIARDNCLKYLGREPTSEELEEEYQELCAKYGE